MKTFQPAAARAAKTAARGNQSWLLPATLVVLGLWLLPRASAQSACCEVTAIDEPARQVTAVVTATQRRFLFMTSADKLAALRIGQKVYANFRTGQVSLDGKTAAGTIVNVEAPGMRAIRPESAQSRASTQYSVGGVQVAAPQGGPVPIRTLAVRVITSNEEGAGTDDDVYFSIGPLGWKLNKPDHNDFERGSDDTYNLGIPQGLTTDDVVLLGLEKKGMPPGNGFYNAPDSPGGAWKPHQVTLYVNGAAYPDASCCRVDQWLEHGHAVWTLPLRHFEPYDAEQTFLRSLRLAPNKKLTQSAETLAYLTTKFGKDRNISGWLPASVPLNCATGTLVRPPATSTDGLATIDLQLQEMDAMFAAIEPASVSVEPPSAGAQPQTLKRIAPSTAAFVLDGTHGIPHTRYLRIEYAYQGSPLPQGGQRVRICGEVYRDMDYENWFEIHPRGAFDVTVIAP